MTIYAPPSIDPRSWTLLSDIDREADEACRRDLESALLPEERVYLLGESPGGTINRVTFGPTAWRFIQCDDAEVLVLYGPRRESKTTASIARLLRLAQTYPKVRPIRAAIVRDTWTNLKRALSLDSLVLTPSGWCKAGDVVVGDSLIGRNGHPTRVLGVYPQPTQPLWTVKFSDGSYARVTGDHLWAVQGQWDRDRPGFRNRRCPRGGWLPGPPGLRIASTDQIREKLALLRHARRTLTVPIVAPIQFATRPVPLDPYVLGVLLGDGGLSGTMVRLTSADLGVVRRVRRRLPIEASIRKERGSQYDYVIRGSGRGRVSVVKSALQQLGLWGHRSPDKFIPVDYLWNDVETRLEVLRGLLDTDGCVSLDRHVSFSSTSERLIEGVEFLARSLGGLTKRSRRTTMPAPHQLRGHWVHHRRPSWTLAISLPSAIQPFALRRKQQRLRGRRRRPLRWIVGIEPDGHGPAVCFRVDSADHLFVANDFIVTHNTVIQNIYEGAARGWWDADFRDQETEVWLNGNEVHVLLMGMERPADATRFQGLGLGVVIIEEPAPAADMTSGVPVEVFAMAVTSLSQPGIPPSVMLITNPPDEDHWVVQLVDKLIDRADPKMRVKTFWVPPGENRHVSQAYRDRMRIGLEVANRGDLVRRLAEGKLGSVKVGEPVTPEFNEERHVAKEALEVRRNFPTFRFFDLWHSPCCIWGQQSPLGYLHILGCIQGENIGVEELIATHIIPWERQYGLTTPRTSDPFSGGPLTSGARARPIRTIIDPSGKAGDQSSTERSAAKVIEKMLGTTCEYGPVAWSARRDAVKALLARSIRGRAQVVIDPEALPLIRALRGGWRYPKTSSGHIGRLPIKDINCTRSSTEMLTVEGWRTHDRLAAGQDVYAYDLRRDRLRRVPLLAVHRFNEHQELLRFHSPQFDIAVTPNHRLVLGHPWAKSVRLVEAREVTASDRILRAAPEQSQKRPWYTNDFVRACAWVFAEGSRRAGGAWHVVQSVTANAEYCEELDALFTRLGGWRVHDRDIRGFGPGSVMRVWRISGEMADAIAAVLPDKIPSGAFIARLTGAQRRLFLYETIRGDGTWGGEPLPPPSAFQRSREFFVRAGNPVVTMKSPAAVDALQALATLGGLRTTVNPCRWASGGGWQLVVSTRSRWSNIAKLEVRHEEADLVWCPQTPLGTWVARDNGRVWISGNSHSGDAFAYGAAVLYPVEEQVRAAIRTPAPTVMEHVIRARSFMGV